MKSATPPFSALEQLQARQIAGLEAEIERLRTASTPRWREALERIADPSYVGSYEPEAVIDIYRTWARAALMGP